MASAGDSKGLQIGIVGAGIAGLSAAIGLRKAGHDVEVFERSQFRNEAGAAVSMTPNGARILNGWGFDGVKAKGIENIQVRRPKGDTLENLGPPLFFDHVEEKYGAKWNFYHRVDVHNSLKEIATSPNAGAGKPVVVRLGSQVIDVDCENGIITVKNGGKYQKDLVVIADGQHDRFVKKITGVDVPMQRSGQTAYRCLIPFSEIMKDPETAALFEGQKPGFWAPSLPAKGTMCVTYPCRKGEVLNCIVLHRRLGQATATDKDVETIEDWNFPASHEDLKEILQGFHPAVTALMMKTPEVKVYTQMKRQPILTLTEGKAVLIGDAAHPMLLTHAQGTSSSIEDAASLEILLRDLPPSTSPSSPPSEVLLERLQLFQKLRLGRVSATQLLTDPVPPGPPALVGPKQDKLVEEIRKYYDGPLPPKDALPHSPPICDFFFGYDVRGEAEKILAEATKA